MIKNKLIILSVVLLSVLFINQAWAQKNAATKAPAPQTSANLSLEELGKLYQNQEIINKNDLNSFIKVMPKLQTETDLIKIDTILKEAKMEPARFSYLSYKIAMALMYIEQSFTEEDYNSLPASLKANEAELKLIKNKAKVLNNLKK